MFNLMHEFLDDAKIFFGAETEIIKVKLENSNPYLLYVDNVNLLLLGFL